MISPLILAQQSSGTNDTAFIIGIIIGYFLGAFFFYKIYDKCGVENAWFAFIPILTNYVNFQAGDEENPLLWTILMLIPCINIVAVIKLIIAWVKICKKLGYSPWLLLLFLIPCINFFVMAYMALWLIFNNALLPDMETKL